MNFDFEKYVELVIEHARSRRQTQGEKNFNEVDYFVGAMVVFDYLKAMDKLPAAWVFGPMSNQSILDISE